MSDDGGVHLTCPALREGCVERCPGCAHRVLAARASEAQKQAWLQAKLAPWRECLSPVRAVEKEGRWRYRDKVCLATVWAEGRWQFGLMHREEHVEIPDCPVHSMRVREMLRLLGPALPPGPVFPMAFYVQSGAQATLLLKARELPPLEWLGQPLARSLADLGLEGLWLHLHPCAGRRLFAKRGWHLVWGTPRSVDGDGLVYGPSAFQQLIPRLYRRALDEAEAFLAPSAQDTVVDLYCGTGASLVRWTRRGATAAGVELGGEAVECAQLNAPEALVLRGTCAQRIPQLGAWIAAAAASGGARLLYVNPPRTGIEPEVLSWVTGELRPERIAYLSCSAGTLRRDLDALSASGYRIEWITPYDFFPQTHHVETLALLRRAEAGRRASIGVATSDEPDPTV